MALFRLPLSGDVIQWINPITWFMSGNQITANVYLGKSSAPEVETEILDRIGTYGRQLGQISDAMIVLLKYLPDRSKFQRPRNGGDRCLRENGRGYSRHKEQA